MRASASCSAPDGLSHAQFSARGLAMSLLQRTPAEWRRQHATPSSRCATSTSADDITMRISASSAATALANEHDDRDSEAPRKFPPVKERKKRKRSAAADEIEALSSDVVEPKVLRAPSPAPAFPKSKTKAKEGEGQGEKRVEGHADLRAIVDGIRIAPRGEGKKGQATASVGQQ
jgi:hypothetical protein